MERGPCVCRGGVVTAPSLDGSPWLMIQGAGGGGSFSVALGSASHFLEAESRPCLECESAGDRECLSRRGFQCGGRRRQQWTSCSSPEALSSALPRVTSGMDCRRLGVHSTAGRCTPPSRAHSPRGGSRVALCAPPPSTLGHHALLVLEQVTKNKSEALPGTRAPSTRGHTAATARGRGRSRCLSRPDTSAWKQYYLIRII